ncbi:MAG: GAF domain-containing protein [Elusimicrobia bacterium]|nr:GAF domain-containing protein [Elusimicrobiota bacterium]
MGPWILAVLCLALLAALWWALTELYRLKMAHVRASPSPVARNPSEQFDQLLSMLIALHEYGVSRTGNVSNEEFCGLFLDKALQLAGSARGTVMMLDEENGTLSICAAKGLPRAEKALQLKPGEGLAGRAMKSGRPIFLPEPRKDPRFVMGPEGAPPEPILSVPLMLKGKPLGVLNIHDTSKALAADETTLKCISLLAVEAAAVLHHQQRYDSLQTFYLEMVQTLARAVDARDAYAHDRVEHSRAWARDLAREMNLPEQMVRYVEFATMLQGVGKIGIDQAILSKPGKLTPEEFEQIKKHTTIGYRMLAPIKFLGPVAQMVLYHQEWYNGRGYPEGLKGEEIPLGSRIVAVVTAWEAMNSDRPYRKRLSREVAVSELKKGAGTQFDPQVVEAFLRAEARRQAEEPPAKD